MSEPVTGPSPADAAAAAPASGDLFSGWEKLTWQERRERRFAGWLAAPGIEFASDEVAALYRERVQMAIDAVCLRKPVRVPVNPGTGFYNGRYSGLTIKEMMYDHEKAAAAWTRFHDDFLPDYVADPVSPGRVFDLLGATLVNWPGHGVDDDTPWQYVEAEYMQADEYDDLIANPDGYFRRTLLPRFAAVFSPLAAVDPYCDFMEAAALPLNILGYADPAVLEAVKKLAEAARAAIEQFEIMGAMAADVGGRLGIPPFWTGMVKAPYDILADTLRGTRGIVMDVYRQRDKVVAAAERFVTLQVDAAVRQTSLGGAPLVSIPLHKGADGFMSDTDFRTIYWPTLKAVVKGLVDEGIVPVLFAEGGYNERLSVIADDELPAGSVIWWFDQTDMAAAKRALGGYACLAGNVPSAMLALGTAQQVEEYVTDLLDECAADGGFILSSGAVVDDAKPETIKAMIETGRAWSR